MNLHRRVQKASNWHAIIRYLAVFTSPKVAQHFPFALEDPYVLLLWYTGNNRTDHSHLLVFAKHCFTTSAHVSYIVLECTYATHAQFALRRRVASTAEFFQREQFENIIIYNQYWIMFVMQTSFKKSTIKTNTAMWWKKKCIVYIKVRMNIFKWISAVCTHFYYVSVKISVFLSRSWHFNISERINKPGMRCAALWREMMPWRLHAATTEYQNKQFFAHAI